ncbi:Sperm-tail_PG-rich repeat [Hexamita inflata]|uniref:Sperm-tail PG-rich repeat n=1 Tax=Hexamita inflata TaxID=28002 RepID=A0AA86NQF7_9EUKA|nr:Sperm-tail PG-rich repeat [Hexamita inflata]
MATKPLSSNSSTRASTLVSPLITTNTIFDVEPNEQPGPNYYVILPQFLDGPKHSIGMRSKSAIGNDVSVSPTRYEAIIAKRATLRRASLFSIGEKSDGFTEFAIKNAIKPGPGEYEFDTSTVIHPGLSISEVRSTYVAHEPLPEVKLNVRDAFNKINDGTAKFGLDPHARTTIPFAPITEQLKKPGPTKYDPIKKPRSQATAGQFRISKRFGDKIEKAPPVGQYNVEKGADMKRKSPPSFSFGGRTKGTTF